MRQRWKFAKQEIVTGCGERMKKQYSPIAFLNANTLRFLALAFMLLDHIWGTLVPGQLWMTCVGRMAFPIFAFQISEGLLHTSNVKRYAGRLFLFALIAEVPFDLMLTGMPFFPFHQNVLFTLLFGLWAISAVEKQKQNPSGAGFAKAAAVVLCAFLLSAVLMVDYGAMGVATVMMFYLLRGFKGARLCQLAVMVVLNGVLAGGQLLPIQLGSWRFEFPVQGFAVAALLLIWLYNGEKGRSSRVLQYAAYAFYPVHALVLYLIRYIISA